MKPLPSQDTLATLFRYDPESGRIYRNALTPDYFANTTDPRGAGWVANNYNSQNAGKEAFTFSDRRGSRHGKILGTNFQAHRMIWKLVHGTEPAQIDHINGDPADNRLSNLRAATNAENGRNYRKRGEYSSRYRGVCWVGRDQAWAARISNGKGGKVSLGNHASEVDAAKAYDAAARRLHGEFATLNFPDEGQS